MISAEEYNDYLSSRSPLWPPADRQIRMNTVAVSLYVGCRFAIIA